jgi:hypothetical protein
MIEQAIRPLLIEPMNPVPRRLPVHAADPGRRPRSIPSLTAAGDKSRRLCWTSFERPAKPLTASAEKSSRDLIADGMAQILRPLKESENSRQSDPP